MQHLKNILLFCLLWLPAWGGVAKADSLPPQLANLQQQMAELQSQLTQLDATLRIEDGKLQNQIDANTNSVISLVLPYFFTLAIAMVYYFFGNASQNGKIKEMTQQRVDQQLDKTIPGICDEKVWQYFTKKFPGDLPHLELAAKLVAYDAELRQTRRIVVLGRDEEFSKPLTTQLRNNGFLSVEFRMITKELAFDANALYLIDRYSHETSDAQIDNEQIGKILMRVKKQIDQGNNIQTHVYGKYQVEKGEDLVTQHNAFTQIPSKLIPNIMDQLRHAYPKNFNTRSPYA